jgi:hypothetical protein
VERPGGPIHVRPIEESMAREQALLSLDETNHFDARGLQRGPISGVGVQIGRRSAVADLWLAPDGKPLVRFCTARIRHSFTVRLGGRSGGSLPDTVWIELLSDLLAHWLIDAMDGEFD